MSMKQISGWALDNARHRGAQYADARIVNDRSRSLATKNGKVGHASSAESLGIGVRVLVNDSWGFASTDDLSKESVERASAQAVEIANASGRVKEHPVHLAAEPGIADEDRSRIAGGQRRHPGGEQSAIRSL